MQQFLMHIWFGKKLHVSGAESDSKSVSILAYDFDNCEAQGKGRAKGRLRKSIVNCQLSIVDYRYRFP